MTKINLLLLFALLFFSCQKETEEPMTETPETDTVLKVTVHSCNTAADPSCQEVIAVTEASITAYPSREDRNNDTNGTSKLSNALGEVSFRNPASDSLFIKASWLSLIQKQDVAVPENEETQLAIIFVL